MDDELKNRIITKYYPKCNYIFRDNIMKMLTEYGNTPVNPKHREKELDLSNDSSPMNTFGKNY